MSRLAIEGVSKSFASTKALESIDLAVADNDFLCILGPSGCGKSTLLRIVAGLRPATTGRVEVAGHPVVGPVAEVGMVFQAPVLLRWRRVLDNVLLPAELSGRDVRRYRARAEDLLRLVGLEDFATKLPRELSGGMQQRASLCRALLLDPPLLLMDEPFGALDAMTRDEMNLELLRVWGDGAAGGRKTILFVTHSIAEAVLLADRVVVMTARPGRIATVVPVPLPRPRTNAASGTSRAPWTGAGRTRPRSGGPANGGGSSTRNSIRNSPGANSASSSGWPSNSHSPS